MFGVKPLIRHTLSPVTAALRRYSTARDVRGLPTLCLTVRLVSSLSVVHQPNGRFLPAVEGLQPEANIVVSAVNS